MADGDGHHGPRDPERLGKPGRSRRRLAGLLGTWCVALVMVGLALGGAVLAANSFYGGSSGRTDSVSDSGMGPMLKGITQLVSMAFGNPLGVHALGVGGSGSFPLLGITAAFCAITWYAARLSTRRWAVGSGPGNLALSLVAGLVNAAVLTLLARITAFRADEVSIHSAGFSGFLVCVLLTTLAVATGRAHGVGHRGLPAHPLLREALRGARTFGYHVLVLGGVLLALGWLYLAVKLAMDEHVGAAFGALLMLPLVGLNLLLLGFGLATFGSFGAGAQGSLEALNGLDLGPVDFSDLGSLPRLSVGIFDAPQWWVPLVALVVSAAAVCLAALFWGARRRVAHQLTSWLVLPVVYLVGGIVVMLASRLGVSSDGYGTARSTLGLAGWWPLVLALVGLAVELAARYLVPTLRAIVPMHAYWWRAEPELPTLPGWRAPAAAAPVAPVVTDAAGEEATSIIPAEPTLLLSTDQQVQANQPVGTSPLVGGPATPMSPEAKAKAQRIAKLVGLALAALVLAAVAVNVVNSMVFGPKKQAAAVLNAIGEGKASQALKELGTAAPEGSQLLLSDDVYSSVPNGLTAYTLGEVDKSGKEARITVQTNQGDRASENVIHLRRTGKRMGLFDKWSVQGMELGSIQVQVPSSASTIEVNGKSIDVSAEAGSGQSVRLPALPGDYTIKLPDQGKYLTGASVTQSVAWSAASESAQLTTTLNEQFTKDVEAKVKEKIDECITTATSEVASSCPFSSPLYYSSDTYRDIAWKVDAYPRIAVGELGYEGGVQITTDAEGKASVTFEHDEGFMEPDWKGGKDEATISPSGTATIVGEKLDQVEVTLS
ncbi:hypothetical protein [Luteococcus sp. OSA5]|uniref:hypothetical protein n=1 Tax=Luteococcus sp. OSA5 TaxID=3401630 RepID=UPI003B43ABFD